MNLSWIEITGLVGLVLVELGLLAAAWIVLFRTPQQRLTMPKWAWALLCLIQFVGPIVFFVAGRKPVPMVDTSLPEPRTTPDRVIDSLYGRDQ